MRHQKLGQNVSRDIRQAGGLPGRVVVGRQAREVVRKVVRQTSGSALVEFSAFSFLFFVFAILAVHISVTLYGAYFNDRACRDAARGAAQGTDVTQATKFATTVLKAHATPNSFLQTPVLQNVVYQDFGGSPPAQTSPYVQVTTTTIAVLPFRPLSFMAGGTILQDGQIPFTKTYTFPIVRVK